MEEEVQFITEGLLLLREAVQHNLLTPSAARLLKSFLLERDMELKSYCLDTDLTEFARAALLLLPATQDTDAPVAPSPAVAPSDNRLRPIFTALEADIVSSFGVQAVLPLAKPVMPPVSQQGLGAIPKKKQSSPKKESKPAKDSSPKKKDAKKASPKKASLEKQAAPLAAIPQAITPAASVGMLRITDTASEAAIEAQFAQFAEILLNRAILMIGGIRHRIAELEFYYNCPAMPDPYPHGDELQFTSGNWYFHRMHGGGYRGGSFKGLDITIGSPQQPGGILIRSLEVLDSGKIVCGPSLSVDHILATCKANNIDQLVGTIMKGDIRVAADPRWPVKPFYLDYTQLPPPCTVLRSGRVGLNMNKGTEGAVTEKRYVFKPYRFFKADRQISKGKLLATLELLAQGKHIADISQTLFCTVDSSQKAANGFEAGKKKKAALFVGKSLEDKDLPEAFGAVWAATH